MDDPQGRIVERGQMATFTQITYDIIFSTKNRDRVLVSEHKPQLFRYIGGVLSKKKCVPYAIGGHDDYLHMLTSLHPSIALSSLIKDVKLATSDFIQRERSMPLFRHWQDGYGAFTHSKDQRAALASYIANQDEHHRRISFVDEFKELLKEAGLDFDPRDLE